ncbi:MAG: restriction endonuclease subunit R [Okeania sp. SIO3I5]|uniref:type I restriction enzyme HsdR N-terminal domain-containing protein n=1 Tax=Okeania sp. SIO3I5 TaxID=2607805 RepID=UPI0013B70653|nr:type I restriction enzyme HsdR N-terminal domain-containing protein [Okeania sp. SIO3I5]NEQ40159.1 restriction endonuclease subunit R [Okeania sp. SIO3I5]
MVQTIPASKIDLYSLKEKFGLERIDALDFFREWQENLPELTNSEKQELAQLRTDYLRLMERPMLEPLVKMVVLSPLLKLAGFDREPFFLSAEKQVEITSEDEGTTIKGKIDILIYTPQFWVLVIEAKRVEYSLNVGIPQILAYMLEAPEIEQPAFGFVTNGSEFIFVKLLKRGNPQYGLSRLFSILNESDLYTVVSILKGLAQRAIATN